MAQQIQLRRDNYAAWNLANPILADGEIGVCRDMEYFKVGDGVRTWSALPIYSPPLGVVAGLEGEIAAALVEAQNASAAAAVVAADLAALPTGGGGGGVVWGASIEVSPVIASAGFDVAHGLGVIPDGVRVRLICLIADNGYVVGDIISAVILPQHVCVSTSASMIRAFISSSLIGSAMFGHKTGGFVDVLTAGRWGIQITPYKFA